MSDPKHHPSPSLSTVPPAGAAQGGSAENPPVSLAELGAADPPPWAGACPGLAVTRDGTVATISRWQQLPRCCQKGCFTVIVIFSLLTRFCRWRSVEVFQPLSWAPAPRAQRGTRVSACRNQAVSREERSVVLTHDAVEVTDSKTSLCVYSVCLLS